MYSLLLVVVLLLLYLTLCDLMDYSLPGSSVHGTLQERIPGWVAMSSLKGCSQSRIEASFKSPYLADRFFTTEV